MIFYDIIAQINLLIVIFFTILKIGHLYIKQKDRIIVLFLIATTHLMHIYFQFTN